MKATGIIRRIDDLGRVVIPKEVRQQMGIREGDPLELYLSDPLGTELILRKYDTTAPIRNIVNQLSDLINDQDILKDMSESNAVAIRALTQILKNNMPILDPDE